MKIPHRSLNAGFITVLALAAGGMTNPAYAAPGGDHGDSPAPGGIPSSGLDAEVVIYEWGSSARVVMGTYSTIQAAVDASSEISFSHVELGDGVYRENVVVMTDSSSANGVSIQAAPGCSPVWRQATAFGPGPILTLDSSADLDGGDVLVDIRNIQFSTAEPDPTDPLGSLIWPTDGAAIVAEADSTGVLGGYETADFLIWIDDCEFLNCRAGQASSGESRDGGAIRVQGVELDIVNCRFDGCHATNAGSISASSSLVEIDNCDFTNGVASANGGVIQAVDCEIQIYESRLSANTAAYHGGAILVEGSSLDLAHCSLRNNAAFAGGGGAVYVREATVPPPYGFTPGSEISDCRFVDNSGPTQPHIMLEGMLEVRMYSTHICPQPSAPESWVTYTGYEPTVETVCADDIADINCDGASDAADLLLVLSHWGSRSHWALPDVTDDGQVDVYDLLQVLSGMASG